MSTVFMSQRILHCGAGQIVSLRGCVHRCFLPKYACSNRAIQINTRKVRLRCLRIPPSPQLDQPNTHQQKSTRHVCAASSAAGSDAPSQAETANPFVLTLCRVELLRQVATGVAFLCVPQQLLQALGPCCGMANAVGGVVWMWGCICCLCLLLHIDVIPHTQVCWMQASGILHLTVCLFTTWVLHEAVVHNRMGRCV